MAITTFSELRKNMGGKAIISEMEAHHFTDLLDTMVANFADFDYTNSTLQDLQTNQKIRVSVDVSLTAAAQTTIYTVPTGKTLIVTALSLLGKTAISGGGKTSTLKIGTTTGSYAELLNGSTGYVATVDTATSLLAVGALLHCFAKYVPSTVSVAPTCKFAAASVIKADVSTGGSLATGGAVTVILEGYLI